jgi:uncharacterized protein YutE (UPF0331/DUF86 family)
VVNADLIAAKLAELVDRIGRARSHCPATPAELGADRDALDLVAFNLMLAVQASADIAAHLIADHGWPVARNLGEGFDRLVEHDVTSATTAERLKRAVGLRNVVAHGYARINVDMVHDAATNGVRDLESFASDVARLLANADK